MPAFTVPVVHTITGWIIIQASDKDAAKKEAERLNDEGSPIQNLHDPEETSEVMVEEIKVMS